MPLPSAARLLEMERRLEREPSSLLFAPLAEMYRASGRLVDAERLLRRGLERHPEHHSAATALGRVLLEQGRHEEAGAVLEEVVASVPDNLLAVRLLGEVATARPSRRPRKLQGGATKPAAAAARPPVQPVPAVGDRLLSGTLADLYLKQGDQQQGIAILRELARREPDNSAWRLRLDAAERTAMFPPAPLSPFPGSHGVPEPLPEDVWIEAGAVESDDPSTLNLVGLPRVPEAPAQTGPADARSASPIPATGPLASTASLSSAASLDRLRALLARVQRYRSAHAL